MIGSVAKKMITCSRCGHMEYLPTYFYNLDQYIFCKSCLVWISESTSDRELVEKIYKVLNYGHIDYPGD